MANSEHLEVLSRGVSRWNQWRRDRPDLRPDLSQAIIGDAELSNIDLHDADLHRADLFGARLYEANLRGADLRRVDFTGGTLANADLTKANLSGAVVRTVRIKNARLVDCNLTYTHFQAINEGSGDGADFTGAEMSITTFNSTDLRAFKGLDTIRHDGPSTIGIDTIYESHGEVPEVFLRGCGVPESLITYARSLVVSAFEFYSCFISYAHADKSFARRLHDTLQGRGIRCWLDEKQILPGDDIYDQVDRGIRLWDKVLLCCSEQSLTSWWVDDEIAKAFAKEQELMKQRKVKVLALIPLSLDSYMFSGSWKSGKASQVKQRLAANFLGWKRNHKKFDQQIERVILALRADQNAREQAPLPQL